MECFENSKVLLLNWLTSNYTLEFFQLITHAYSFFLKNNNNVNIRTKVEKKVCCSPSYGKPLKKKVHWISKICRYY